MKMNRWMEAVLAASLVCAATAASAQVKIGVTLSATGPDRKSVV